MQWCNSNSAMSRMPKLYYCASSHQGVSVFLAAYMSCVYLDCEAVLIGEGQDVKTASGADYGEISLGCRLPCLVFEDGNVITQEPVILEYVADKVAGRIAPHYGTKSRYEVTQFISQVHASMIIIKELGCSDHTAEVRDHYRECLNFSLESFDRHFRQCTGNYAIGDEFTIADAYLLSMLLWLDSSKMDLGSYLALQKYRDDLMVRPDVKSAMNRMTKSPRSTIDASSGKCMWIGCP